MGPLMPISMSWSSRLEGVTCCVLHAEAGQVSVTAGRSSGNDWHIRGSWELGCGREQGQRWKLEETRRQWKPRHPNGVGDEAKNKLQMEMEGHWMLTITLTYP